MLLPSSYGGGPYREMRRLQNEMNRLFETASSSRQAGGYPAMNVYASEDGVAITAEIPGVSEDDLEVSVHRDTVTVKAERKPHPEQVKSYHRRERGQGSFMRTLSLPFTVDPDAVEADYRNGVLKLSLRRPEEDKPKRIRVRTS